MEDEWEYVKIRGNQKLIYKREGRKYNLVKVEHIGLKKHPFTFNKLKQIKIDKSKPHKFLKFSK